jgi:hypothetical protein
MTGVTRRALPLRYIDGERKSRVATGDFTGVSFDLGTLPRHCCAFGNRRAFPLHLIRPLS